MKAHNYVYTIVRQTPDENGIRKGYIGVHCTDNLEDGYFGSGHYLKRAIKKYGRDDFVKTIVADFPTEEEAVEYETELLHRMHRLSGGWELFSERFYNLTLNESRGKVSLSESTRKKIGEAVAGDKNPNFGKTLSESTRKKIGESLTGDKNPNFGRTGEKHPMFGRTGKLNPRFGKTLSESTRKKIGEAVAGDKNPNFGKTGDKNPNFGKTGEQCGKVFKGFSIGTSLTDGKIIIFNGTASMKARGFSPGAISYVISGKLRHHKNFTFIRTKDPNLLKDLLDQNNFVDEQSKIILEEFLRNS